MNLLFDFTYHTIFKRFCFILPILTTVVSPSRSSETNEYFYPREKRECPENSPTFEVKAVLIPCSVQYVPCSSSFDDQTPPKAPVSKSDITTEKENISKIRNSSKKLIITVKMTNMGVTNCNNQYVVVDQVFDQTTERNQRLLYPYVLKIKQKPLMQTYTLIKESDVNEKSRELVKNKNDKDFKGCATNGEETTCRRVMYHNKPVPYSAGFCCSCNDHGFKKKMAKLRKKQKLFEKEMKILPDNVEQDLTDLDLVSRRKRGNKNEMTKKKKKRQHEHSQKTESEGLNQLLKIENKLDSLQSSTEPSKFDITDISDITDEIKFEKDNFKDLSENEVLLDVSTQQEIHSVTAGTEGINELVNVDNMLDSARFSTEQPELHEQEFGKKILTEFSKEEILTFEPTLQENFEATESEAFNEHVKQEKMLDSDQPSTPPLKFDEENETEIGKIEYEPTQQTTNDGEEDEDDELEEVRDELTEKENNVDEEFMEEQKEQKEIMTNETDENDGPSDASWEIMEDSSESLKESIESEELKKILKETPETFKVNKGISTDNCYNNNLSAVIRDEDDICITPKPVSGKHHHHHHHKSFKYSFFHPRGGQDCRNKTCPPGVDPYLYQQSAHCLVFSNLWYTVYKLEKPKIVHEFTLEIFEKHEDPSGHVSWEDITKSKPLILGSMRIEDSNKERTIWAGYSSQEPHIHAFSIDPEYKRLLVPGDVKDSRKHLYPELRAGPSEWLVIPNHMISYDGSRCDKVGVGYEAFVKQPNRCEVPKGTCLRNQPRDLWYHDHNMEKKGKYGSYFLKYFGFMPKNPLQNDGKKKNLSLYFRGAFLNVINIEMRTDYNLVIRPHAAAVITEVYTDSTNYIKSSVTVKVTNAGLMYGAFYIALTDCPLDMPASFSNIQSKSAVISPQHQHIYLMEIMCALPDKKFFCSVEVKNKKGELLAFRRVRFQKNDRCICIWHCACTCLETDGGLKCKPLTFDQYNAAGFHGGLPMAADYIEYTLLEELSTLIYHLFLTMTFVLILLGVLKGLIGLCYRPIGEWGLCSMFGLPKRMERYHENSLRGRRVVYDKCGWPVHPDTRKRVRNVSLVVEFCINIVFFLMYPLVMINLMVRRMCVVEYVDESEKNPCCLCGQTHAAGECPSFGVFRCLGFGSVTHRNTKCPAYRSRAMRESGIQYSSKESCGCSCY